MEDKGAKDYLSSVSGLEAIQEYKRRSHDLLRPARDDRVLDVGCGLGQDLVMLAEHVGPEGDVIGIDKSASLIVEASEQVGSTPGVSIQVGDVLQLPFEDGAFDGCRADRVFQHLPDPEKALAEMHRVTRAGGRITVSDPDWRTWVLHAPGLDAQVTQEVTDEEWVSSRNPRIGSRLYALVRKSGLVDVEIDPLTVVVTDFETANQLLSVRGRVSRLREASVFSTHRVDQWIADLRSAADEETFFCSMTGYTVAGSVPRN